MTVLELTLITVDEDLQPRVTTDHNISHEYGLAMARGDVFPPVDVFFDGEAYWLADGFHRYYATEALGLAEIDCTIHQGSYDDALWFTCSANSKNGLHRKREDVQLAIERAFLHPKGAGQTDSKIAAHVGCTHPTVASVRARLEATCKIYKSDHRTGQDGRTINVKNIGASQKAAPDPEPNPALDAEQEEPEPPDPNQTDIEDIPGVKPSGKVAPLIDPAWAHLSEQIHAVVKAHGRLPGPGVAAANYPDVLAHSLDIEDVEAIARWWAGFVPLWRARQPEIQRYIERIKAISSRP